MAAGPHQITVKIGHNIALVHDTQGPVDAGIIGQAAAAIHKGGHVLAQTVDGRELNLTASQG